MASRQGSNLVMDALEKRIIHCDQGIHARVRETSESNLDFRLATGFLQANLLPDCRGGIIEFAALQVGVRILRIDERADHGDSGHKLF